MTNTYQAKARELVKAINKSLPGAKDTWDAMSGTEREDTLSGWALELAAHERAGYSPNQAAISVAAGLSIEEAATQFKGK
jgi:hypothetical protein